MTAERSIPESANARAVSLPLEEAAADHDMTYAAFVKYIHRHKIFLAHDPNDRRRLLFPLSGYTPAALEKWQSRQLQSPAPQASQAEDTRMSAPLQGTLALAPDPSESAYLGIPEKHLDLVKRRLRVTRQLIFKEWEKGHSSEREFIQWVSAQEGKGFAPSAIYAIKATAVAVLKDATIPDEEKWREIARCLTPRRHPGKSGLDFFSGQRAPLREDLKKIYRREGGPSAKRTHAIFCKKFFPDGGGPTERQIRTAVSKLLLTDTVRGHEAVKVMAGYIDRHYDDELAGDAWCIDEWELDGCFYNEENHKQVINYGAGRPIAHILSVIDERTTCVLAYAVTWKVSLEEATLDLAEYLLRTYWAPLRLIADRAGRFRCLSRGRVAVGSDGELIDLLAGPLGEFGVKPRLTKERNPRGNRIERALHREFARRATEFGISWRGANTEERKLTDIDARVARHLKEHRKLGVCGPQLLSIQEAEKIIATWVNDLNTCETRAKGCKGLTRLAAFNWFRPAEEEIARRKYSDTQIDLVFAEHDERMIQAGGVIQLSGGARYGLQGELSAWIGNRVALMRRRRDHSFIEVSVPGQEAQVIAHRRTENGVNEPEALSEEIARLEHARKVIAREEAPLQVQGPGPRPDQELGSVEYLMDKKRITHPAPQVESIGAEPEEKLPSLYDFTECRVEKL